MPGDLRQIDAVGCLELLNFNYLLGSRTLVSGIGRLPWRAEIFGDGTITRYRAIPHGAQESTSAAIAMKLRAALEAEIEGYVEGTGRVWVLLSGGLDSRVVAGILNYLKMGWGEPKEIRAVTWGHAFARDVVYARRVAQHFGWPIHVIDYTSELFWSNMSETADWGGGEISGIHLHGMQALRALVKPEDVIIAGSWGNSIGRGTFLSRHLAHLTLRAITNPYGLVVSELAPVAITEGERDRATAWDLEEDTGSTAILELDQQENYMRRMIGQAMDYLRAFGRLEQAFTDPAVVSLMWSFAPKYRMAEVCYHLINGLDRTLYELPNAATGISPGGLSEPDPLLTKSHHEFGQWCRITHLEQLRALVKSESLANLGVWNMSAIGSLFSKWTQQEVNSLGLTEVITNLAGIAMATEIFGLHPARDPSHMADAVRFRMGRAKAGLARARKQLRSYVQ